MAHALGIAEDGAGIAAAALGIYRENTVEGPGLTFPDQDWPDGLRWLQEEDGNELARERFIRVIAGESSPCQLPERQTPPAGAVLHVPGIL